MLLDLCAPVEFVSKLLKKMHSRLFDIFSLSPKHTLDSTSKRLIIVLFYLILIVFLVIISLLFVNYYGHKSSGAINLGTFGDFFGGVLNPLLTFLTVVGLAITIITQRVSATAGRVQAFESMFFNMLDLHGKIIQELAFDPKIIPVSYDYQRILNANGQKVPTALVNGRHVFKAVIDSVFTGGFQYSGGKYADVYKAYLQDKNNDVLGHYFRNLYQILRLIERLEEETGDDGIVRVYSNVIRAQLSAHELKVLFYNCSNGMVDDGNFQRLVKHFRLLEHLPLRYDPVFKIIRGDKLPSDQSYYEQYLSLPTTIGQFLAGQKGAKNSSGAFGTHPEVQKYLLQL